MDKKSLNIGLLIMGFFTLALGIWWLLFRKPDEVQTAKETVEEMNNLQEWLAQFDQEVYDRDTLIDACQKGCRRGIFGFLQARRVRECKENCVKKYLDAEQYEIDLNEKLLTDCERIQAANITIPEEVRTKCETVGIAL